MVTFLWTLLKYNGVGVELQLMMRGYRLYNSESYKAGMFILAPGCKGISPQSLHTNSTLYQKLIECGYTYSLDYITQTSICMSEAGLALEAGGSSLCSLCTCALPPGGCLQGSVGGRLTVLLTLYFAPEHAQILLANFLNNESVFQPVYSSYLI